MADPGVDHLDKPHSAGPDERSGVTRVKSPAARLLEPARGWCYTTSTDMRYYAEWLDGEYLLLNHTIHGYNHFLVMQRAIRFHALFGSTIVLSDVQMIDSKTPIPTLFLDCDFRAFLKEKPDFLALVADQVPGTKHHRFGIAMNGVQRVIDQENKPEDSYEMALTRLGEPILRAGSFDADRYLKFKHRGKGQVARVIRRFPQYRPALEGLLHALDYFSRGSLPNTTNASVGSPERYDTLLMNAQKDDRLVSEAHTKRIEEILRIQKQLPEAQWGRRAAIRKLLGTGKWQHESWKPKKLRLYLDVVHAWNCAINRHIAPEAGTLFESRDDIPLSRFERSVTDAVSLFRAGPMPSAGLPVAIRRFLSWDPLDSDWEQMTFLVNETRESAQRLQTTLKIGNSEDRRHALAEHAAKISEYLVNVPTREVPQLVWWTAKAVGEGFDFVLRGRLTLWQRSFVALHMYALHCGGRRSSTQLPELDPGSYEPASTWVRQRPPGKGHGGVASKARPCRARAEAESRSALRRREIYFPNRFCGTATQGHLSPRTRTPRRPQHQTVPHFSRSPHLKWPRRARVLSAASPE